MFQNGNENPMAITIGFHARSAKPTELSADAHDIDGIRKQDGDLLAGN
jgi:hypothetical protein